MKTMREEINAMTSVPMIVFNWVDAISRFVIFERIKRVRPAVMTEERTINIVTSDQLNSYEIAEIYTAATLSAEIARVSRVMMVLFIYVIMIK
jgi:hypothetical protein